MRKSRKNQKPLAMQKGRRYYTRVTRSLVWGSSGLRLLGRALLPRGILFWLSRRLLRGYRREMRHNMRHIRTFWLRVRTTMPLTKKSEKSRMGKGKGKLTGTFGVLQAGNIIFEFRYTNYVSVKKFLHYFTKRFVTPVQPIMSFNFKIPRPLRSFKQFKPSLIYARNTKRWYRNDMFFKPKFDIQRVKPNEMLV